MAPSLATLSTLQIIMDSTLYGCFMMLFTVSSVVLNNRCRMLDTRSADAKQFKRELQFWKVLGNIMAVLTTCHWAFAWVTMMAGLKDVKLRSQMSFMRFCFEMLSIFVGDSLMLSRLWTIGGKRVTILTFPLSCLLGFTACALRLIVLEAQHLLLSMKSPKDTKWWFLASTALTTSVNLYCTGYIAWRAWSANRLFHKSAYNYFLHVASITVESAAIYTIWTFILLGFVTRDLTMWSLFLPVSPSLYGCTMMLISVRLGLGWALGLGGQAAKQPKSLMQFAKSEVSRSEMSDMEYN